MNMSLKIKYKDGRVKNVNLKNTSAIDIIKIKSWWDNKGGSTLNIANDLELVREDISNIETRIIKDKKGIIN